MTESDLGERRHAFVLDASALLAYLFREPGAEFVGEVLPHALISAVNWTEILQRLCLLEVDTLGIQEDLTALGLEFVPYSTHDAAGAAKLYLATRARGLSLGDRACLAVARNRDMTALTADRAWLELSLPEIRIDRIR